MRATFESSKLMQNPGTGRGYAASLSKNTFKETNHFTSVTSLSVQPAVTGLKNNEEIKRLTVKKNPTKSTPQTILNIQKESQTKMLIQDT